MYVYVRVCEAPHTHSLTFHVHPASTAKDEVDAYFKGEIEACGYSFITDNKWTCTSQPPSDDAWLTADFDDSHWERASWVSLAWGARAGRTHWPLSD